MNTIKTLRLRTTALLRRTAARPELVWMMAPPPIIAFECEYFLPPNAQSEPRSHLHTNTYDFNE